VSEDRERKERRCNARASAAANSFGAALFIIYSFGRTPSASAPSPALVCAARSVADQWPLPDRASAPSRPPPDSSAAAAYGPAAEPPLLAAARSPAPPAPAPAVRAFLSGRPRLRGAAGRKPGCAGRAQRRAALAVFLGRAAAGQLALGRRPACHRPRCAAFPVRSLGQRRSRRAAQPSSPARTAACTRRAGAAGWRSCRWARASWWPPLPRPRTTAAWCWARAAAARWRWTR